MGRVASKRRSLKIRQKQKRKQKLKKLRQLYMQAKSEMKRDKVLEKVAQVAPWLTPEEFLASTKKTK